MLKTKEPEKEAAVKETKANRKKIKTEKKKEKAVKAKKENTEKLKKAPKEKKQNLISKFIHSLRQISDSNTENAAEKRKFPLLIICTTAVSTALFMVIVASFMQISQIQAEMKQMEASIRSLKAEERELSMELEGKYSSKIESIAADMGLSGKYHKTYYIESNADSENKEAEKAEAEKENKKSNSLLNAISKSFEKFLEFID